MRALQVLLTTRFFRATQFFRAARFFEITQFFRATQLFRAARFFRATRFFSGCPIILRASKRSGTRPEPGQKTRPDPARIFRAPAHP